MASNNAAHALQARYSRKGILSPTGLIKDMLDLSDEQTQKLEPLPQRQQDQMNALRQDSSLSRQARMRKLVQIQQETDRQLSALLTPEQAQKLQDRARRTGPLGQPSPNQGKAGWALPGVRAERAAPATSGQRAQFERPQSDH